jgi:hypothetical protein
MPSPLTPLLPILHMPSQYHGTASFPPFLQAPDFHLHIAHSFSCQEGHDPHTHGHCVNILLSARLITVCVLTKYVQ